MSNWKNHQSIHDTLSLVFYRCSPIITNFFSSSQQHFPVISTALLALLTKWFTQYFRDIALNSCSSISNCLALVLFFIREASCGRKREHSQSSFILILSSETGIPCSAVSPLHWRERRETRFESKEYELCREVPIASLFHLFHQTRIFFLLEVTTPKHEDASTW